LASEDDSKLQGEGAEGSATAEATPRVRSAAATDEGDDLASLAAGIASVRPGSGESADADDEDSSLGALARASKARNEPETQAHDDARLDLARLVGNTAAGIDAEAARRDGEAGRDLAAAAAVASVVPPARPRTWIAPLLVGLGLGAGLAGVVFGMSANRGPAAPGASAATEPANAPPSAVTAAAPSAAATVAPEGAPVALAVTSPATAQPAPPAVAGANPAPAEHRTNASTAPRTPARVDPKAAPQAAEAAAEPAASAPPVLTVKESAPAASTSTGPGDSPSEPAAGEAAHNPRSMDALLDEALAPAARRQELEHQRELVLHQDELPLTPSRDDVTKAMTVLLPAIRGCAMGQSGLATAGIVVRNDGRVASVEIAGPPFAGTASGRCMEGVMRRAQFPRFKQALFRIKFPFAIQ
jgi:hypothetical protein